VIADRAVKRDQRDIRVTAEFAIITLGHPARQDQAGPVRREHRHFMRPAVVVANIELNADDPQLVVGELAVKVHGYPFPG
jgi:hypothetical protein